MNSGKVGHENVCADDGYDPSDVRVMDRPLDIHVALTYFLRSTYLLLQLIQRIKVKTV
jgi:hypothetical protein